MLQIPDVMSFEKPSVVPAPFIDDIENKKKAFGFELSKGLNPFEAACIVVGNNTSQALYISQNWLNDSTVVEARKNTVHNSDDLLDADQLAAKLLKMAEEKNATNTFYMLEGKDRVALLNLYAKIRGYDKSVAPPGGNTFIQNTMTIKLVESEKKIIEHIPEEKLEVVDSVSPIKLKLVG